jgi:hypothetical protein
MAVVVTVAFWALVLLAKSERPNRSPSESLTGRFARVSV